jgi:hypothetical protein
MLARNPTEVLRACVKTLHHCTPSLVSHRGAGEEDPVKWCPQGPVRRLRRGTVGEVPARTLS